MNSEIKIKDLYDDSTDIFINVLSLCFKNLYKNKSDNLERNITLFQKLLNNLDSFREESKLNNLDLYQYLNRMIDIIKYVDFFAYITIYDENFVFVEKHRFISMGSVDIIVILCDWLIKSNVIKKTDQQYIQLINECEIFYKFFEFTKIYIDHKLIFDNNESSTRSKIDRNSCSIIENDYDYDLVKAVKEHLSKMKNDVAQS